MAQFNDIAMFLTNLKDNLRELDTVYQFIQTVRSQHSPAPVVEIFTILKYEKPLIYKFLKQRVQLNPPLNLMIGVSVDFMTAKKRLGIE